MANLQGANLTSASLQYADITGANLEDASLSMTDMQGVGLYEIQNMDQLLEADNVEIDSINPDLCAEYIRLKAERDAEIDRIRAEYD